MASFSKTLTISFETPTISTDDALMVRKTADAYLRTNLTNITSLATILMTTFVSAIANIVSVRNKEYQAYTLTYTISVDAPTSEIAVQAIEGALVVPTDKNAGIRYNLIARKAV